MMHFLNATDVLTNRVNCSGSTFNLTFEEFCKTCAPYSRGKFDEKIREILMVVSDVVGGELP